MKGQSKQLLQKFIPSINDFMTINQRWTYKYVQYFKYLVSNQVWRVIDKNILIQS